MSGTEKKDIELSIVMPCLNEAETIGSCIGKAQRFLDSSGICGEIVIGDNGSEDGSIDIAKALGARVINVPEKGYGNALIGGILEARGKYIIMGDSDDSHDLENLMPFLEKLREGYELVVGNRFIGESKNKKISYLWRSLGNQGLSIIGKIFYRSSVSDFHCGLRGFSREAFDKMKLRTTGMEFASEMIVKASFAKLKTAEVPTVIFPPGRSRPPHLRPIRDGWRHLRFLLLYSPRWLFLYPGLGLIILGVLIGLWLLPGSKLSLDIHTMLYASVSITIGFQAVAFAVISKVYAMQEKLLPESPLLKKIMKKLTLEVGLLCGILLILTGLALTFYALYLMESRQFHSFGIQYTMRIVILSVTLMSIGFQIVFFSFFLSVIKLKLR
ncbi:MAG: hypothetical protein QG635_519 [Bacteroidota bacterium]|nr:hypothetical protein [Bacteroidota bacterium]